MHRGDAALRSEGFSPRQLAAIAGAAYLVTSVASFWNLYAISTLVVSGDSARTAANIVANAVLFACSFFSTCSNPSAASS